MYVKVYQYHIKQDKQEEYLRLQKRTLQIYKRYTKYETLYLNSEADESKWIEIMRYDSREDCSRSTENINRHPEIQGLFEEFEKLLSEEKKEITEDNFHLVIIEDQKP
ncbi:hypothetical protein V1498_02185 [Peribacillus sp. SCS-26]|uniref:hypothetical protein n=1 Tax=Paraperibacillus marinus TaxID=3115295 RepID=UPI003905C1AC